jgi:lipoate-protein ligase A
MPDAEVSKRGWMVLDSGPGDPAWNMALDEALLEAVSRFGRPLLRLYSWSEPAATFGYSQRYGDLAKATPLRPLIRRATGGGLVLHDADWTYSLVFPPSHFWFHLRAEESYRLAHEWVCGAFARLDVVTELSPICRKEVPGQCFFGAEKNDLLWHGRKIAGAAQRRPKTGLLIQGSVQPPPICLVRSAWHDAMAAAGAEFLGAPCEVVSLDEPVANLAESLSASKYSAREYNQKW